MANVAAELQSHVITEEQLCARNSECLVNVPLSLLLRRLPQSVVVAASVFLILRKCHVDSSRHYSLSALAPRTFLTFMNVIHVLRTWLIIALGKLFDQEKQTLRPVT